MASNLQSAYFDILSYLKNTGKREWTLKEVQDAFAMVAGMTNPATVQSHVGRMCRLDMIVWNHGQDHKDIFSTGKVK